MNKLALALILLTATGCSTLFSRANPDAENAAEKDGKNRYSASEPASPSDLKDQKILHLESTVTTLNSRIQELEGKLQAVQAHPDHSVVPETAASKAFRRQVLDGVTAVNPVNPSVAANDPGAGYVNDASVRAFQQGKLLFDQEKYPESILAFSAFLETNRNHPLASSAQYYIGENYYRQSDYAVADTEFQKLASHYPQSPRVSYALVRLSQTAGALGKTDEAKRYKTQVEGLFPKSPALKLFREAPVPTTSADHATVSNSVAHAATPIATAPALTIEAPSVAPVSAPEIASPKVETPTVEAPHVEAPTSNAPHARVSGDDLDQPPGGGG